MKIPKQTILQTQLYKLLLRDDMISDGIENCVQYMSNFNPEKSKNPFAHFTQIIYYFCKKNTKRKENFIHQIQNYGQSIHT